MLNDLLEKRVIQLPELKMLEEVGRTPDPKYCRYQRLLSQPLENASHLKGVSYGLSKMGQ